MKKLIVIICMVVLSGCVSVDMNKVLTVEETNGKKLPTMEAVYIDGTSKVPQYWDTGSRVVQSGTTRATLFYQQVEKNLTDPYGDMHGYIELRDNTLDLAPAQDGGWDIFSALTLGIFNLLGMPAHHFKPYSEINIRVLDKTGKLIKRYHTSIEDSEYAALYWGYSLSDRDELLLRTYRKALDEIIEQMQNDKEFLSNKLK